jgi:DNA-binding CsgD family transcriptional regulator
MNAKAIPAPASPGPVDPPLDASAAGQVAMVVMLVPIPTPAAGAPAAPPPIIDSNDQVWLLVDKASPMAAVFEQITAPELATVLEHNHQHVAHTHSVWPDLSPGEPAHQANLTLAAEPLSRRELDVLRLMADGQSNQEIAHVLVVALNTVKMHIKHIYRKLNVKNRVQAVAQAHVLGLVGAAMH